MPICLFAYLIICEMYHIPALLKETVSGLVTRTDGTYVDATFGGGGHSRAILERLTKGGTLYGLDQDEDAMANIAATEEVAKASGAEFRFVRTNFRYLGNWMDYYAVGTVDGILADIGVSFHHFDEAERGFSFRFDGPLDMRMNQRAQRSAADIVNNYEAEDLARVLYLYGELRDSRAIARRIISKRPITRIQELVSAVGEEKKTLTCVFQALRIEVNDELGALRELLETAQRALRPGGRIAVLTYHSLEDRIVKNYLRAGNTEGTVEKDFYGNAITPWKVIEKGMTPSEEEVARNPRARSAKLRIAEKR